MKMKTKREKKLRKTLQNFCLSCLLLRSIFYIPHHGIIKLKGNQPLLETPSRSISYPFDEQN